MNQPLPTDPFNSAPAPATPAAGFAPVTPIGDTPLLSLVPPIGAPGEPVRHPDPIATGGPQQPLPTSRQIPVAPVRRRTSVTPLIAIPTGVPLQAALSVAPVIPVQPAQQQLPPAVPPAAYSVQPMSFPLPSAPAFHAPQPYFALPQQQAWGYAPPMGLQTYVAFVNLVPQPPQPAMPPAWAPPGYAPQPQPMYPPAPQQYGYPQQAFAQQQYAQQPYAPQPYAPQPPYQPYPQPYPQQPQQFSHPQAQPGMPPIPPAVPPTAYWH